MLGLVQRLRVGLPRDPFDVAMTERVDRRPRQRVVHGDLPVLLETEDLAAERSRVLRVRHVPGVAGRHVELAVGTELHATAVMDGFAGDVVEEHGLLDAAPVLVAHAHELVARAAAGRIAVVEVHEGVAGEVGIDRDPEEATLRADLRAHP